MVTPRRVLATLTRQPSSQRLIPRLRRPIATVATLAVAGVTLSISTSQPQSVPDTAASHPEPERVTEFDPLPMQAQPARPAGHRSSPATNRTVPAPPAPAGVNALALASRPGSERTIYLDVTGGTVPAESSWTTDPLPYPAYTVDSDPALSADEQGRIYAAWEALVEDFAPYDVNITTVRPPMSDLVRTDNSDTRFGVHALVVPMGSAAHHHICDGWCSGMAYRDGIQHSIKATSTREALPEPVWVFTHPDTTGSGIGTITSHEVGHALGLSHDGYDKADYFAGSYLWAPIMGGNDGSSVVTQWSNGGYEHANNFEDDYAKMDLWLPRLPDDYAGREAPTGVDQTAVGVIESNTDSDAFVVRTQGKTTISATPTASSPNLDLTMAVYAEDGTLVTQLDFQPGAGQDSRGHLGVSWTGTAPVGGTVTVVLEGTGLATRTGSYSDYGSTGRYRLDVTDAPTTLRWDGPKKVKGVRVGRYMDQKWKVRGSLDRIILARTGSQPRGLRIALKPRTRMVRLVGVPRRAGTHRLTFTAEDIYGDVLAFTVRVKVKPAKRQHPPRR